GRKTVGRISHQEYAARPKPIRERMVQVPGQDAFNVQLHILAADGRADFPGAPLRGDLRRLTYCGIVMSLIDPTSAAVEGDHRANRVGIDDPPHHVATLTIVRLEPGAKADIDVMIERR